MRNLIRAALCAVALAAAHPAAAADSNPFADLIPTEAEAGREALRQALAHCLKVHGQPGPDDEDGWHEHYACGDRLVAKWRAAVTRALEESRRADREAERRVAQRPAWMRRDRLRATRL